LSALIVPPSVQWKKNQGNQCQSLHQEKHSVLVMIPKSRKRTWGLSWICAIRELHCHYH
jgi:hypothetical protein